MFKTAITEAGLFIKRFCRDPKSIGSIIPSSSQLGKSMAKSITHADSLVIEIGAGTGAITSSILERGLDVDNFIAIEWDRDLARILRSKFDGVNVMNIDATKMPELLPERFVGKCDYIISTIPSLNNQNIWPALSKACKEMLKPYGKMIALSYDPTGLMIKRCASANFKSIERFDFVWFNFPPGSVYVLQN